MRADGQPYRWDLARPIRYQVDPGTLGRGRSHAAAVGLVERAMQSWQQLPAGPRFQSVGELTRHITGANILKLLQGLQANDKRVVISLTYIHGIGRTTSEKLLRMANVNVDTRVRELGDEEMGRLRQVIDRLSADKEILIEGDLRREVAMNIKRLQEIGTYRGMRHRRGLPTRGQRTRTNARARRGPRRPVAGRKKKGK